MSCGRHHWRASLPSVTNAWPSLNCSRGYSRGLPKAAASHARMVTALVPSLSRGLAEQFNVFRVMHHGTHEKQLSNVFAWLLRVDETHELGDLFQRLFIEQVNRSLPSSSQLPTGNYRVVQEVATEGHLNQGGDIADILLTSASASVVVENYEWSDGHGHDYHRYLAHGAVGGRQSVVVLLCARRQSHRQVDGWEHAVVVTYAELLESLRAHVAGDRLRRRGYPRQDFFINELVQHFTEGLGPVSGEDRIAFIKAMCETGEGARYGYRPQNKAAQEFGDLLALHAKRQFEEGRTTLAEVKKALRRYAERTLIDQVNGALTNGHVTSVKAPWTGKWEWCVTLRRADSQANVHLEFGPTAVEENGRVAEPLADSDYSRIFVTREVPGTGGSIDRIIQTDVGLAEVLAGLSDTDQRLHDGVLAAIGNGQLLQTPMMTDANGSATPRT